MEKPMETALPVNKLLKRWALYIVIAGLLLGLAMSSFAIYQSLGGWGVLLGILLFPYTLVYFPLYTLLTHGNWTLLLLNYGSVAMGWVLLWIAEKKEPQPRLATDEPPTQPVATKDNPALAIILVILGIIILATFVYARVR
jgi:hypothetical protein